MYIDTLLFAISAVCAALLAIFSLRLILSRKKSKIIGKIIKQETEYTEYIKNGPLASMGDVTILDETGLDDADENKTLTDGDENAEAEKTDAGADILNGAYIIEKQIYAGPMSRVYSARSVKLGSKWIIKFIPRGKGGLTGEYEKLKDLTHIGLPKIIDIFENERGTYLVESLIEGKNLRDVIKENKTFNQFLLINWAVQLCDVYSYLHNLPGSPIYHLDIKPANIMLTHNNRLVPIDFGISKSANDDAETTAALSPNYAAPEQFNKTLAAKYKKIMDFRFGELPDGHADWKPDGRTDIFSLGAVLFELAAGENPRAGNLSGIKNAVSPEFAKIILKCLQTDPNARYQTMDEISADLRKLHDAVKNFKLSLFARKITAVIAAASFVLSAGALLGGAYIYRSRNHLINSAVNVAEPADGTVDIVQIYEQGQKISVYGGTRERAHTDGLLGAGAEFAAPGSIAAAESGELYIADSGELRKITGDMVETVEIEPFYIRPGIVRCEGNEVYILTGEWEEPDGFYRYGIFRIKDGAAEEIYAADAAYTAIEDFGFSHGGGLIYFIERNAGVDNTYFKTINLKDFGDIRTVCELPKGTASLAPGDDGTVYFANPETGVIQYYDDGALKYFAGTEGEKALIDGSAPLFYMPQKIKYADNALYIWDFNVLRKITIENGAAAYCITLAGTASPEYELEHTENEYAAEDVSLAYSIFGGGADFAFAGGDIILTDPKRGIIWRKEQ